MDWHAVMDGWDRQQEGYMGNREERFDVIVDVVARLAGDAPTVLDLCCGPGSLGRCVLRRLPGARVLAVDADPVLQLIGERSHGDERTTWIAADLLDPAWAAAAAPHGPFDAVVSTTALHWLGAGPLAAVYGAVGRLLRPGGIFADGDHLVEPRGATRLRALQAALRAIPDDPRPDYETWWAELEAAAAGEPDLAHAFELRAKAGSGHPDTSDAPGLAFHEAALRHAGFTEVGTVWQRGDDRVLVALT